MFCKKKNNQVSPSMSQPIHAGPINGARKCHDVFFLYLFILFWGVMGWITFVAVKSGNPNLLLQPTDENGYLCGNSNSGGATDMTSKPYLYYFNPINPFNTSYLCVSGCPSATSLSVVGSPSTYVCDYAVNTSSPVTFSQYQYQGNCTTFVYQTMPILNRCVPNVAFNTSFLIAANYTTNSTGSSTISISSMIDQGRTLAVQVVTDVRNAWQVLAVGMAVAFALTIVWVLLLQIFAGPFTVVSIVFANILLIDAAVWLYFYWQNRVQNFNSGGGTGVTSVSAIAGMVGLNSSLQVAQWEVYASLAAFIFTSLLAVVLLIITITFTSRIRVAVEVLKDTCRAIRSMPFIFMAPFVEFLFITGLFVYYIWMLLYFMSSSGSVVLTLTAAVPDASYLLQNLQWVFLFGLLWGISFIVGLNHMIIAGAISSYYWTFDKKTIGWRSHYIWTSIWRTFRYHLGSVAIGSLIMAFVQMLQVFGAILQYKVNQTGNKFLQCLVGCLNCCLAFLARMVKFYNKNCYIQIAISGESFFASARHVYGMLISNSFKLMAFDFVADFVLFLSQISIAVGCGAGAYAYIVYQGVPGVTFFFPFLPAAIVAVQAYVVAGIFLNVFQMSMDTTFICVLYDTEINDGSNEKPFYMSDRLLKLLKKKQGKKQKKTHGKTTSRGPTAPSPSSDDTPRNDDLVNKHKKRPTLLPKLEADGVHGGDAEVDQQSTVSPTRAHGHHGKHRKHVEMAAVGQ